MSDSMYAWEEENNVKGSIVNVGSGAAGGGSDRCCETEARRSAKSLAREGISVLEVCAGV